jgi:hypothetical protein
MFLQVLGIPAQGWAGSEELELLRDYVERLAREEGRPSDVDALLKDGYEALPRCLPGPQGDYKSPERSNGIRRD